LLLGFYSLQFWNCHGFWKILLLEHLSFYLPQKHMFKNPQHFVATEVALSVEDGTAVDTKTF
jgi:hypothetical protein